MNFLNFSWDFLYIYIKTHRKNLNICFFKKEKNIQPMAKRKSNNLYYPKIKGVDANMCK